MRATVREHEGGIWIVFVRDGPEPRPVSKEEENRVPTVPRFCWSLKEACRLVEAAGFTPEVHLKNGERHVLEGGYNMFYNAFIEKRRKAHGKRTR